MESNYWKRAVAGRISRRRALGAVGGAAFSAAFLAACGSDNKSTSSGSTGTSGATGSTGSSGSTAATGATGSTGSTSASSGASGSTGTSGASSGLITEPENTLSKAKAGGVIKDFYTAELTHMDALLSNSASTVNLISVFAYPRMMKFTVVETPDSNDGSKTEGETAESMEVSPDGLTVTFKLRQNMLWDRRAPTNNRAIDAEDVMFSWDKWTSLNASAPYLAHSAAPGAAVDSLEAPDSSTIIMKLVRPEPVLATLLAGWDVFYIMPRESDGGFDPKSEIRGHGPWILDEYVPSSHTNWDRNPDYYVKDRPFPDRLERVLVPEYAARLAQFKAGNIHTYVASNEDIVQSKKDVSETVIYQDPIYNSMTSSYNIYFGYEGDSIFRDLRLRQAVSMALDRDSYAQVLENIDRFAADGIDIVWNYNSQLSPGWGEAWLDPADTAKFGESVKYLQFHPDESKALVAAAGYPNGVEFDFFHNSEGTYGAAYAQTVEIHQALLADVGLKATLQGKPYAEWLAQYHYGYTPAKYKTGEVKGFNGISLNAERTRYTPALSIFGLMHPEGDAFHGTVPPSGQGLAIDGDPTLSDMLAKVRLESDRQSMLTQIWDVQRYISENANYVPRPSNSKPLRLMWPVLGNAYAFDSSAVGRNLWAENYINWWIDTSKPPLA
jgi:peptide/nickel transport system substrate-binding protein